MTLHSTEAPVDQDAPGGVANEGRSMQYLSVQRPENVEANQWTTTSNISGNLALYDVGGGLLHDALYCT